MLGAGRVLLGGFRYLLRVLHLIIRAGHAVNDSDSEDNTELITNMCVYLSLEAHVEKLDETQTQMFTKSVSVMMERLRPQIAREVSKSLGALVTVMPSILTGMMFVPELYQTLCEIAGAADLQPLLTHLLGISLRNNFAVEDAQLFNIGEGIAPFGSLLNHSCQPNAIALFTRNRCVNIKLLRDVAAHEEITLAYCDLFLPGQTRRTLLCTKYAFNCCCER